MAASPVELGLLLLALCLVAGAVAQPAKPPNGPVKGKLSSEQMKEREALLALKAAVTSNQFGTSKIKSWKNKGGPCTPKPWPHVSCKDGHVTGLSLSNLNVAATLPLKLRQLNKLETLQLDGNRFVGNIPSGWADPNFFQSLATLDLHGNQLDGKLPSKDWNKKGAFKSLTKLDLSNNGFYGGLPVGWLAGNKVFTKLTFLDISNNALGTSGGADAANAWTTTTDWCLTDSTYGAATNSYGWCPTKPPLSNTMPNLVTMDLSYNSLAGPLPSQWPVMFPSLQYLLIAGNKLYSGPKDSPAILPAGWTQDKYPVAFPQLSTLLLYPGNDNICNLPNFVDGKLDGYLDVNPDNTYAIMGYSDTVEEAYSKDNIWECKGPSVDNPPASIITSDHSISFLPALGGESTIVFGYRVTIEVQDPQDDSYKVHKDWNGKVFRTYAYTGTATGRTPDLVLSDGAYTITVPFAADEMIVHISTLNMDGRESQPANYPSSDPTNPGSQACIVDSQCDGTCTACIQNKCQAASMGTTCYSAVGTGVGVCTAPPNGNPGTCVGCLSNSDCTDPSAPTCNTATNTCVGCQSNSECSATTCGVCNSKNQCSSSLLSCTPNTLGVVVSPANTVLTSWKLTTPMALYVLKFHIRMYEQNVLVPGWENGKDFVVAASSVSNGISTFQLDTGIRVVAGLAYRFDMVALLTTNLQSGFAASVASGQMGNVLIPINPYVTIPVNLVVTLSSAGTLQTSWQVPTAQVINITKYRIKVYENGTVVPGWENSKDIAVAPSGVSGTSSLFTLDTGIPVVSGRKYMFEMYSLLVGGTISGLAASVAAGQQGPVVKP